MTQIPQQLKYTEDHEWVRAEADGSVVIGITDHAQHQLGELVYVELPDAGRTVTRGDAMAVVESTKAASDVYAPLAGVIVQGNPALAGQPELVNTDPYGEGWLVRLRPADAAALAALLDSAAYAQLLAAED
ncbi:MAG: glycine cleavage system protein GcvH [Gammaproteobacteria bacterium]|nr:glycine cleavage system protein GcvH [Gammaproteobacteria bacterium]MCP5140043.1 glycine cleavage system protein GcvH [Chromatiales bacterium]